MRKVRIIFELVSEFTMFDSYRELYYSMCLSSDNVRICFAPSVYKRCQVNQRVGLKDAFLVISYEIRKVTIFPHLILGITLS